MDMDKLCENIIYLIQCKKTTMQICKYLHIRRDTFLMAIRQICESGTPLMLDDSGEILTFGFPKRDKTVYDMPIEKEHIKVALIGDTHLVSKYEDLVSLNRMYDIIDKKDVDVVFHSGDLVDGLVSIKGYFSELKETTYEGQLKYAIDKYPRYSGKTYAVSGNHDDYWHILTGKEIIKDISVQRDDIIYLGSSRRLVDINGLKINVLHGKFDKKNPIKNIYEYVDNLSKERRPNIIHSGHYHNGKYELYKEIQMFRTGTYMKISPQGLKPDNFTYILDVYCGDDGEVEKIDHKVYEIGSKRR